MSAAASSFEEDLRAHLFNVGIQGALFVLNLPDTSLTRWLVSRLFGRLFGNVVDAAVEFDRRVGAESVQAGSAYVSGLCGAPPQVSGKNNIPLEGPLLLASNHPGYFDSMVVLSQLPRSDVKIIVSGVPYFNELPHVGQHVLYTDHSTQQNVRVLRECVRHLRQGGCVLIFPTGLADPDPDCMNGARQRILEWSDSLAVMMRHAPQTQLLPVSVSGILAPKYLRHPAARMQSKPRLRQRVAEFFQMVHQFRRVGTPPLGRPRLSFGSPLTLPELEAAAGGKEIMPEITAAAQAVLDVHMKGRG